MDAFLSIHVNFYEQYLINPYSSLKTIRNKSFSYENKKTTIRRNKNIPFAHVRNIQFSFSLKMNA